MITRAGTYREYVQTSGRLPYIVRVPILPEPWAHVAGGPPVAKTAPHKVAEFHKVGLTDSFGRPIYVQRW